MKRCEDEGALMQICRDHEPQVIIHLAARRPGCAIRSTIPGHMWMPIWWAVSTCLKQRGSWGRHLLMASTSSVYGANTEMPFGENQKADTQLSFYAATKKATEAMAHAYAHIHGLPITMFRFFTVYGPWGQPDMALFKFTKAMLAGEPIDVYNHGRMQRDFTYIDDLVEGISRLIEAMPPAPEDRDAPLPEDSLSPQAPWRVVNIGNASPVELMVYIAALEKALSMTAEKNMMDMQPGDVTATWAETSLLHALTGYTRQPVSKKALQNLSHGIAITIRSDLKE